MPPDCLHDVPYEQQEVHNGEEDGCPFVLDAKLSRVVGGHCEQRWRGGGFGYTISSLLLS